MLLYCLTLVLYTMSSLTITSQKALGRLPVCSENSCRQQEQDPGLVYSSTNRPEKTLTSVSWPATPSRSLEVVPLRFCFSSWLIYKPTKKSESVLSGRSNTDWSEQNATHLVNDNTKHSTLPSRVRTSVSTNSWLA